jgi:hypothetical protein
MKRSFPLVLLAGLIALGLAACGGSDPPPERRVVLVLWMVEYDEVNSFLNRMDELKARNIVPSKIECGLLDPPGLSWFGGYSPRLAYMTVTESEASRVRDLSRWIADYEPATWEASPPSDCGPLPKREAASAPLNG